MAYSSALSVFLVHILEGSLSFLRVLTRPSSLFALANLTCLRVIITLLLFTIYPDPTKIQYAPITFNLIRFRGYPPRTLFRGLLLLIVSHIRLFTLKFNSLNYSSLL